MLTINEFGGQGEGNGRGRMEVGDCPILSYTSTLIFVRELFKFTKKKMNENILLCILTPLKLDLAMIDTQFLLLKNDRFIDNQKYELRKNT